MYSRGAKTPPPTSSFSQLRPSPSKVVSGGTSPGSEQGFVATPEKSVKKTLSLLESKHQKPRAMTSKARPRSPAVRGSGGIMVKAPVGSSAPFVVLISLTFQVGPSCATTKTDFVEAR